LSNGQAYCRYSDDFHLFCKEERDAYESLAFLANTLFENHGLTLQQYKTKIMNIDDFIKKYIHTEKDIEQNSLIEKFQDILDELGIDSWYEEIEYDDLDPEIQSKIDALNLTEILEEQIKLGMGIDIGMARFVLRRLKQINDPSAVDLVLNNIEILYPIFKDALCYITAIRKFNPSDRQKIGNYLINLIDNSIVGHLVFHKCWILNTFTKGKEWDNDSVFQKLFESNSDDFSRRELISAMGRANHDFWFKTHKRNIMAFEPWQKRAFLAAASCLPGDEAKHWYGAIYKRLDGLEKTVVDWAKTNPY